MPPPPVPSKAKAVKTMGPPPAPPAKRSARKTAESPPPKKAKHAAKPPVATKLQVASIYYTYLFVNYRLMLFSKMINDARIVSITIFS